MATNPANASARSSLLERIATSPRAQRRFGWISAAVLIAGIVTFLLVVVLHNTAPAQHPLNTKPQPTPAPAPHVKPSKDAFKVAREFLETAVARKHLHEAWNLVAAPLKAGETRKQWESGNNPVIPFSAMNAKTVGLQVVTSTKGKLYLQMQLLPVPHSGDRADTFYMELTQQKDGRWLVDYFEANNPYGVPAGGGVGS